MDKLIGKRHLACAAAFLEARDDEFQSWYLGRSGDVVISSGYNILAPEVETALCSHPAVQECAAVWVPCDQRGQRAIAFMSVALPMKSSSGEQSWVARNPWLRGTRIALSVNNLFNTRPEVRDAAGLTPLGYRPDELDPLGRTIRLSIRKLFF